ncbi:hypothetical protein [Micromonospora echinofusca]|uniref:hypothetical protein n=1 Tax=Micromonospora echinofusca TaxID=47858 RepID=UPI0012FD4DA0|nr:hypothetical protein [Micromonospora echinofusca]
MPRKRTIEVLTLAQRIEAELESGRVDDVEMGDDRLERIAALLRPAPHLAGQTRGGSSVRDRAGKVVSGVAVALLSLVADASVVAPHAVAI